MLRIVRDFRDECFSDNLDNRCLGVSYITLNLPTIRDRMKYQSTSDLILLSTENLEIARSFHQNWWFDLKIPGDLYFLRLCVFPLDQFAVAGQYSSNYCIGGLLYPLECYTIISGIAGCVRTGYCRHRRRTKEKL